MKPVHCGCTFELHVPTGAQRSVSKCRHHKAQQRDPATLDEAYYTELGVLKDGKLAETRHVAELVEALGELPRPDGDPHSLEIGCGISPYFDAMRSAGWRYSGIDLSGYAVEFMLSRRGASLWCGDFEKRATEMRGHFGLILAAHSFEHMVDAPGAIAKAAGLLVPGGELWIIVPDDSDPVNSDHLWFFSKESLKRTVELAGLRWFVLETRRHVAHENFLYIKAAKPS